MGLSTFKIFNRMNLRDNKEIHKYLEIILREVEIIFLLIEYV